MNEIVTTVVGRLTNHPVRRQVDAGREVVTFRMACNHRYFDRGAGEWREASTSYLTVDCWRRSLGRNIMASVVRGNPVIVHGRLHVREYEQESRDFRREIQLLVEKKYEEKRSTLAGSYEKAIRDLETLERKERLDAIARFEEFLRRYPDDARYTPDVMFRLAELYYERSSDDHLLAMREYEERLKAMDPAKNEEPPPEPQVDFSKSITIYRGLITKFPDYKLNDAAYYLLGYCLEKIP